MTRFSYLRIATSLGSGIFSVGSKIGSILGATTSDEEAALDEGMIPAATRFLNSSDTSGMLGVDDDDGAIGTAAGGGAA
jgi:hypothetical protein